MKAFQPKNIKEHNFFEVYGWCYAQNAELISYEVKVNNKDVLFEIDSIYRSDVLKEIKINDKEKNNIIEQLTKISSNYGKYYISGDDDLKLNNYNFTGNAKCFAGNFFAFWYVCN